ncbi:tetratricopeptide repeat protein [Flavobacterium foetidum]|uniref:tetratricopeptide repeat protein n=1 Tax=Flavobacterium foetidum TaxID=2026681 RepID=UPI0010752E93|nr:tetratricopeptide repeat protein [Flavobacterium foetidum]KAF2515697.1 tetratricopeptide repeat protein [Flavobacterium foetidum]
MISCAKKIRFFFVLSAIVFFVPLRAQNVSVASTATIKDIESLIIKESGAKKDTVELKKRLSYLEKSSSKKSQILYAALLANGYAAFFDKINSQSEYYYLKSIEEAKKLNDTALIIWTQLNYCKYLYFYCQIDRLIPIVLKTMDQSNQINALEMILPDETFKFFGWIMSTVEDDSAISYYKKSMQYMEKTSSESAGVLNAIGNCYFRNDNLPNALHYFNQSEAIALKIGDTVRYAKILGDKALVYEKRGNLKDAVRFLKQDILYSQKFKIEKNEMYASILLAKILLKLKYTIQTEKVLERAGQIASSKSYYRSSLKEVIELKLSVLNGKNPTKELLLRRQLKQIEEYLLNTNGNTVLQKSHWLIQKKKYENDTEKIRLKLEEQERTEKIYILIVVFTISVSFILYYILNKKLKHKRIKIQNDRMLFEQKLNDASSDLNHYAENLKNKNRQISILENKLEEIKNAASTPSEEEKTRLRELLNSHLMTDENWNAFKREFIRQHGYFYTTLIENFPELKESNLKIIMLQKLDLSNYEMSNLLGVTVDAIKKNKQRLKKKLGERYDLLFEIIDK